MHCQELYRAEDRCPHNIQLRLKREKQVAMRVPLPPGVANTPPKTAITRNGKPAPAEMPVGTPG
jgi:NosR/NirI family nitrous oxide reductase transcriptional regulator